MQAHAKIANTAVRIQRAQQKDREFKPDKHCSLTEQEFLDLHRSGDMTTMATGWFVYRGVPVWIE